MRRMDGGEGNRSRLNQPSSEGRRLGYYPKILGEKQIRDATPHIRLSTIIFLISAIAFAGLRPFGQVFAQFMMVWQR